MPARRIAPQFLGHPGIRIGVLAQREHFAVALQAAPAGDGEGHDHAVADTQVLDGRADLHDFAHELMAEHIARFIVGIKPL